MAATKAVTPSDTPKKFIRYSSDELLALRKKSTVLQEMQKFSDIVSMMPLEPLCKKPPSEEEVLRYKLPKSSRLITLGSSSVEQCNGETAKCQRLTVCIEGN